MAAKLWLMALTAFDVPRVEAALFLGAAHDRLLRLIVT
jgi:hypothetical protein